MEFQDDAFVLSARLHGDTGAVVELLTEQYGRRAAYVNGGASRKMKPFLQAGTKVVADFRSRTSDQLGSARLEPMGEGPASLFDDPLALVGLNAAAAVAAGALPEREPHPGAFYAFEALMGAFAIAEVWPAIFVRYEAGLLETLGFGLDLSRCASTGEMDDLVWVSPRTGRAVSRTAGAPYADKLLRLPPFMLGAQAGLDDGDVRDGLALTGHFLEQYVFHALNKPLPPARVWMMERLQEAGRL
ncbi:DNA repair protein RecO [Brevundimonas terrae]|uniref:DNA repair protein RecO n=1 Tax=Brevundimonas terrae TaxID=363631 RepID=A0ABN0YIP8_9CAUL|nr:DNA repair protein RecO [Brevundimonas terrae]NIJ27052.1 DNA repair protein RecO (recombination protein O) [Brevundimonas terrae]